MGELDFDGGEEALRHRVDYVVVCRRKALPRSGKEFAIEEGYIVAVVAAARHARHEHVVSEIDFVLRKRCPVGNPLRPIARVAYPPLLKLRALKLDVVAVVAADLDARHDAPPARAVVVTDMPIATFFGGGRYASPPTTPFI